jgi:Ribbon-helix-helix protein, copG family
MKRVTVYLTDEEYETLRRVAYERHVPMSALLRAAKLHLVEPPKKSKS